MLKRLTTLAILIAPLASANSAPLNVTFTDLAAHPRRYSGKRVTVVAYYDIDSAGHSSYFATKPNTEFSDLPHIFVDLPRSISAAQARAAAKHRVKVVGIFQYRELKVRVVDPGGPGRPGIEEHTLGFGWMGIYDKQLTKLSQFSIVG